MTEVRRIPPELADEAAEVIVRSFHDDPGAIHVEPDPDRRADTVRPFFRFSARLAAAHGDGFVIGRPIAAVALISRQPVPTSQADPDVGAEALLRAIPETARVRALAMVEEITGFHHELLGEPHWFVGFLATDPERQARGYGTRLLDEIHDIADQDRVPTWLTTFLARNVTFYEGRGYETVAERDYLDAFHVWAMRRPVPAP